MKRWLTEGMLFSVIVIWGANYTVGKIGLAQLPSLQFNGLRFLLASPLLFLLTLSFEHNVKIDPKDLWRICVTSMVGIFFYQALFLASLQYTSATNSALFIALSPIFASLFALLTGQERFSLRMQIGSVLAFAGAALVLLGSPSNTATPNAMLGNLLALLASIMWGLYPIVSTPLVNKYSPLRVMAWTTGVGAIPFLLFDGWGLFTQIPHLTSITWLSLAYSILFVTIYGLVAWYSGIKRVGTTRGMVYMYLVPLIAAIVAALFLHEPIYPQQIIGGLIILLGLWIVKMPQRSLHK